MRKLTMAAVALALAGCATAASYPAMHPMTQAHIDRLGATPVVVI
jgi:hypothetical protein